MDKNIDWLAVIEIAADKLKLKGQDKDTALKNIDKIKSIRAEIKKNKEKRECTCTKKLEYLR